MKTIIITISIICVLVCAPTEKIFAMKVVSFSDYDLSRVRYLNRVRLSHDSMDFDFETDRSDDANNDGVIDFLEEQTFITQTDDCRVYIGNASSRYGLHNVLLWIGVDGTFHNFTVDELIISTSNSIARNDPAVVVPHGELASLIDSVVLIDMEEGIGKRSSIHDPISSCQPKIISLHSLETQDASLRMYIAAFGSIKSGFNSYTPVNSDVLWIPEVEIDRGEDTVPEPIPEGNSGVIFGIGGMVILWWKKKHRLLGT